MKCKFRLFSAMLILLLVSASIFTGCNAPKTPDKTQMSIEELLSFMSDVSDDGRTITVISEEYLNEFWSDNYEKEVIHSFTKEEVDYIIQDSIRIYNQYDKIILSGFVHDLSVDEEVSARFPFLEGQEISTSDDVSRSEMDIYTIIMYRLKALSSPKALFTGADAFRFIGYGSTLDGSFVSLTTYYIPSYSESTDRKYILSVIGNNIKPDSEDFDSERFSDLFSFCTLGGVRVGFATKEDLQYNRIFPEIQSDG